jgi:hypothetical protein
VGDDFIWRCPTHKEIHETPQLINTSIQIEDDEVETLLSGEERNNQTTNNVNIQPIIQQQMNEFFNSSPNSQTEINQTQADGGNVNLASTAQTEINQPQANDGNLIPPVNIGDKPQESNQHIENSNVNMRRGSRRASVSSNSSRAEAAACCKICRNHVTISDTATSCYKCYGIFHVGCLDPISANPRNRFVMDRMDTFLCKNCTQTQHIQYTERGAISKNSNATSSNQNASQNQQQRTDRPQNYQQQPQWPTNGGNTRNEFPRNTIRFQPRFSTASNPPQDNQGGREQNNYRQNSHRGNGRGGRGGRTNFFDRQHFSSEGEQYNGSDQQREPQAQPRQNDANQTPFIPRGRSTEINRQPLLQSSRNNTTANRSDIEIMLDRNDVKKLPEVVDDSDSWFTFIEVYGHTREMFPTVVNYTRVQEAIKCEKIKKLGGANLRNLDTFEEALQRINRELQGRDYLEEDYNSILAHPVPSEDNNSKVYELLLKILHLLDKARLSHRIGYLSGKKNIYPIMSKLPRNIYTKCEAIMAKKSRGNDSSLNLIQFEKLFEDQKVIYRQRIEKEKIDAQQRPRPTDKKVKNNNNTPKSYNTAVDTTKRVSPTNRCWLHKSDEHGATRCSTLWGLSGIDVATLAGSYKVCSTCGFDEHDIPCPNKDKITCNTRNCGGHHYALFCSKRPGKAVHAMTHASNDVWSDIMQDADTHNYTDDSEECSNDCSEIDSDPHDQDVNVQCFNILEHKANKHSSSTILGVISVTCNDTQINMLYDSGSSVSLFEEKVAHQQAPGGKPFPLILGWTGDYVRKDDNSLVYKLRVKTLHKNQRNVDVYVRTVADLGMHAQTFVAEEFKTKYSYLRNLDLIDHDCIHGIIGIDNQEFFTNVKTYQAKNARVGDPIGYKTPLGDFVLMQRFQLKDLYESLPDANINNTNFSYRVYTLSDLERLEYAEMEKAAFNLLDNLDSQTNDRENYDDKKSIEILNREVKREEGSKNFVVPLLWKDEDNLKLPTEKSKIQAIKRFRIQENVMRRNADFAECENEVKKLLNQGFARKLTVEERTNYTNKSNYVPIFFIKQKRTRMIWDMAAQIDGIAINDHLMRGPNNYNSLLNIMMQAREQEILMIGDVAEMFHMAKLREEDTEALRFVFRFSDEEELEEYKMLRLPFGAKCSPAIAQYLKEKIASEHQDSHPEASLAIAKSTYVDDAVITDTNIDHACNLMIEMKKILDTGGFNLLKLNSNKTEVLKKLREYFIENGMMEEKLIIEESESKVLGYLINFAEDWMSICDGTNKFSEDFLSGKMIPSKRMVLAFLMSSFDPIGLTEFLKASLKFLYRKISSPNVDWDDKLPLELMPEWKMNLSRLTQIQKIKIPRQLCPFDYDKIELHSFGDAGQFMQCAVIYARFMTNCGNIVDVKLLQSKSYVVSVKKERSIPELELDVSAKLVELTEKVKLTHRLKFDKVVYYTDNQCVLYMIKRKDGGKDSVYTRNRLNKIRKFSNAGQWRWVETALQPADYGTKPNYTIPIDYENEWFKPTILFEDSSQDIEHALTNYVYNTTINNTEKDTLDFESFSTLPRAIFAVQFILRMVEIKRIIKPLRVKIGKLETKQDRTSRYQIKLLKEELKNETARIYDAKYRYVEAEYILIRHAQRQAMHSEISMLSTKETLPKNHWLAKKQIWMDTDDNLIRANTRLNQDLIAEKEDAEDNDSSAIEHSDKPKIKSKLTRDQIFPIVLPKNHRLTQLYILHEHTSRKHCLHKSTVAALKSRFFIQHMNSHVKNIIRTKCYFCIRYIPKPEQPMMGDIPLERLNMGSPAFTCAIMDIAGPIKTNLTRNVTADRYILVYVCLTTRGVHLELLERIDTEATLLGIQNCFNIRGSATSITCDNGLNFVGANNTLTEITSNWNKKLIEKGIIRRPVEFKFGPARASHFQGSVERVIGTVKQLLKKTMLMIKDQTPLLNDFTLRSILNELANLINNQPLTIVNEEEVEFLTPNHFLTLRNNCQEVPVNSNVKSLSLKNSWIRVKEFSALLWEQWLKFYLPNIIHREKWIDMKTPLAVNDIVLTLDTKVADSWTLGVITEISEGSKDQVRRVKIRLGKRKIADNVNRSMKNKSHDEIMKLYNAEKFSEITRPACAVYKLNI